MVAALALLVSSGVAAGELRLRVDPAPDADAEHARALLARFRVLEDVQALVASELRLPRDVHLRLGGDDGPLYDPAITTIVIPYFFIDEIDERLARTTRLSPRERDEVVVGVVEHTLYHELGHALVDLLDLPVGDREEDAVDTLATILMVEGFEGGEHAALDAMEDFLALDELEGDDPAPGYFDEHSVDIERYESGICLAHGSDPAATPEVGAEMGAQRSRACIDRWRRERDAWMRRLAPVLRPGGEFARGG